MDEPADDRPGFDPGSLPGFGFDEGDSWMARAVAAEAPLTPGVLGPYDLLETVGAGAQGIVYRARHRDTGQIIALKRLMGGAAVSPTMRARFDREIDSEAGLSHPNIVSVHRSEVVDGQPLLAMEWIDGVPVDRWAAGADGPDGRRTLEDRLRVFLKICKAVEHAHQRGVIHRDLKPSNIIVDHADEPHVLDFGLAKLMRQEEDPVARLTRTEGFVGTLIYAAPEQLRPGRDGVDTRTDVYALGIILYQLLTDRLPLDPRGDLATIVEAIQREEPARPSTVVPGLDHDLDAIVAKAMAKEKDRRYVSVDAMATDLRRHLAGEPIEARRASRAYILRKAIRRHRVPVALAVAFILLLAGAAITSTLLWQRAERERRRAETSATIADEVNRFFHEDLLGAVDPAVAQGRETTVREVLDKASREIEGKFADNPLVEADIRLSLGTAYLRLGRYPEAIGHHARCLDLRERELGRTHPLTLMAISELGDTYGVSGDADRAEPLLTEALEGRRRILGPNHEQTLETMHNLALVLVDQGRLDEAERLSRTVWDGSKASLGPQHPDTLITAEQLGGVLDHLGRHEEAIELLSATLKSQQAVKGPEHPDTLATMMTLAKALIALGRLDDARAMTEAALAAQLRVLGPEHRDTLVSQNNLAYLCRQAGRFEEAAHLYEQVLEVQRRVLGEDVQETLITQHNLAACYRHMGRLDLADPMGTDALARMKGSLGEDHPLTIAGGYQLALLRRAQERYSDAEALLVTALQHNRTARGEAQRDTVAIVGLLRDLLLDQQRRADAERLQLDFYDRLERDPSAPDELKASLALELAKFYEAWDSAEPGTGKAESAAQWHTRHEGLTTPPEGAAGEMDPGPSPP